MATPSIREVGVRAKIERAKHHIGDLEERVRVFLESKPYSVAHDKNSETCERVCRVQIRAQPPLILPLIVGEVLHQLRGSLDHLAWQLVEANGEKPGKWTYFPICE